MKEYRKISTLLLLLLIIVMVVGMQIIKPKEEKITYRAQDVEEHISMQEDKPCITCDIDSTVYERPIATKEMTPREIAEEEYYDSLELLAICVEAEAGNQSMQGKRMVVDVILNRVDDSDWPDTITEVIGQYKQFSSYWDGAMDNVWEASEETYKAVQMELEKRSYPGIYYFTAEGYGAYGTPWKKVEDHYFCTK